MRSGCTPSACRSAAITGRPSATAGPPSRPMRGTPGPRTLSCTASRWRDGRPMGWRSSRKPRGTGDRATSRGTTGGTRGCSGWNSGIRHALAVYDDCAAAQGLPPRSAGPTRPPCCGGSGCTAPTSASGARGRRRGDPVLTRALLRRLHAAMALARPAAGAATGDGGAGYPGQRHHQSHAASAGPKRSCAWSPSTASVRARRAQASLCPRPAAPSACLSCGSSSPPLAAFVPLPGAAKRWTPSCHRA